MTARANPALNLLVCGPRRSGKTRLARMLTEFTRRSGLVVEERASVLLHELAHGARAERRAHELVDADVLVVDDLKPDDLRGSASMLAVLDRRQSSHVTIITTTATPEAWLELLFDPLTGEVIQRFLESGRCVELTAR